MLKKYKICADLDFCLSQLEKNSKLAVALSREYALNNRLISNSKFYCFEKSEIIYNYALKFLVRKDFSYLKELNTYFSMTASNGLIEKWYSACRIRSRVEHNERKYGILTIEYFQMTYFEWLCIEMATILILLIEMLVYKESRKPNPSRIWILIDMFIDSDRHFWLKNKCYWKWIRSDLVYKPGVLLCFNSYTYIHIKYQKFALA